MNTSDAMPLATLSEAEALTLLGTQEVGRLVYTRRALPAIIPVNYALRAGAIWIWTASSSSMAQAVRASVVAFEVDQLDPATRAGWSVTVIGVARIIHDPAEIERAHREGPTPWAAGRTEHLIKIPLQLVSGRRLRRSGPGEDETAALEDETWGPTRARDGSRLARVRP
jgi:uncharacterized protein